MPPPQAALGSAPLAAAFPPGAGRSAAGAGAGFGRCRGLGGRGILLSGQCCRLSLDSASAAAAGLRPPLLYLCFTR